MGGKPPKSLSRWLTAMGKKNSCKICTFFQKFPYRASDLRFFEKACREGKSLRKLELLLESYGLKCNKDTIAKHIKTCMKLGVSEQRKIEKQIKREKNRLSRIGEIISKFFSRPEEPVSERCEHRRTELFFDISVERVCCRCLECGEILGSGVAPEDNRKRMRRAAGNSVIIRSLKK